MNVFAKFDEIPSMILKVIKETYVTDVTDTRSVGQSDNVKTVTLPQTQFAGGITMIYNTNIDLVNDDVYTKFGFNLSIRSQDIE